MQLQPWQQGPGEKNWGRIPEMKADSGLMWSRANETDKNIKHFVGIRPVVSLAQQMLKFATVILLLKSPKDVSFSLTENSCAVS